MSNSNILVVDNGSRFETNVVSCCEQRGAKVERIAWQDVKYEEVKNKGYKGIILSGSPFSVYKEGSPTLDRKILELGVPVLGICYGAQLIAYLSGKKVDKAEQEEQTLTAITLLDSKLFEGLPKNTYMQMRHSDRVYFLPEGHRLTAYTKDCPIAAYENDKNIYALQFHPEIEGCGDKIFDNFLYKICNI